MKQYHIHHQEDTAETTDAQVLGWLESAECSGCDVQFSNLVMCFKVLCASSGLRMAIRERNSFAIDANIKFLLPLLFTFGHTVYSVLLLWNLVRISSRCTQEMEKIARHFVSINGQGLDFMKEENIQLTKRNATGKSVQHLQMAAIQTIGRAEQRKQVQDLFGIKPKKPSEHMPFTYAEEVILFDGIFRDSNCCSITTGRNTVTSVDGKLKWIAGEDLSSRYEKGEREMLANFNSGFTKPVPKQSRMLLEGNEMRDNAAKFAAVARPEINVTEDDEVGEKDAVLDEEDEVNIEEE